MNCQWEAQNTISIDNVSVLLLDAPESISNDTSLTVQLLPIIASLREHYVTNAKGCCIKLPCAEEV